MTIQDILHEMFYQPALKPGQVLAILEAVIRNQKKADTNQAAAIIAELEKALIYIEAETMRGA